MCTGNNLIYILIKISYLQITYNLLLAVPFLVWGL